MYRNYAGLILFIIAFHSIVLELPAQDLKGKGIKAGFNLSNIYGKDKMGETTKPGLVIGAYVVFGFTEQFSIIPEILYTQKGFKSSGRENNVPVEVVTTSDYLEIDLLGNFEFQLDQKRSVNLFIGPGLDLKLKSRAKVTMSGAKEETKLNNVSKFDFILIFGGNYSIKAWNGRVMLEPRYTLGFISFYDTAADLDLKLAVFSVLMGYSF